MSQLMAHNFLVLSQQDTGLESVLAKARSLDDVLNIASKKGFDFTESEFNVASYQFKDSGLIDEADLEVMTYSTDLTCVCARSTRCSRSAQTAA